MCRGYQLCGVAQRVYAMLLVPRKFSPELIETIQKKNMNRENSYGI